MWANTRTEEGISTWCLFILMGLLISSLTNGGEYCSPGMPMEAPAPEPRVQIPAPALASLGKRFHGPCLKSLTYRPRRPTPQPAGSCGGLNEGVRMKGAARHFKDGRGGGADLFGGDAEGRGGWPPHPVGGGGHTWVASVPHCSKAATW